MSSSSHSSITSTFLAVRAAVAFLGEKPQSGWWDTSFLNSIGFQYLSLIYPKTVASAALTSAFDAARRIHDERIGLGRVAHLFRLPLECELVIGARQGETTLLDLSPCCTVERALGVLDSVATGTKVTLQPGPVQIGKLTEAATPLVVQTFAAMFAVGFRSAQPVFPYLG